MYSARDWREYPRRYRLEAGKCKKCGKIEFPTRLVCSKCGAREFETEMLPDTGKVLTYTVIRTAPSQFTDIAPYAIAIAELTNGVKLTAQLVDCDVDKIKVGDEVRIEFRRVQTDAHSGILSYGYKFVPKWY